MNSLSYVFMGLRIAGILANDLVRAASDGKLTIGEMTGIIQKILIAVDLPIEVELPGGEMAGQTVRVKQK